MDVKLKFSEFLDFILRRDSTDTKDTKSGLELFGGGLHVHFHISINPTFPMVEKEK